MNTFWFRHGLKEKIDEIIVIKDISKDIGFLKVAVKILGIPLVCVGFLVIKNQLFFPGQELIDP